MRKFTILTLLALFMGASVSARPMTSPNGKLSVSMDINNGQFVIAYQGQ